MKGGNLWHNFYIIKVKDIKDLLIKVLKIHALENDTNVPFSTIRSMDILKIMHILTSLIVTIISQCCKSSHCTL